MAYMNCADCGSLRGVYESTINGDIVKDCANKNCPSTNKEGFHKFHDENGDLYGSFEVYWSEGFDASDYDGAFKMLAGWYWIACQPGCLPDSDEPEGPFESSIEAFYAADEFNPNKS